jgi:hypothetical protein
MRDAPLHLAEYKVLRAKTARESDRRAWIRAYSAGVGGVGGGAGSLWRVVGPVPSAEC